MFKLGVVLCCCCLAFPVASAEVYVWTDEFGETHYGDKPPTAVTEDKIQVTPRTYELHNLDEGYPYTDPDLYKDQTESYSDVKRRQRDERDAIEQKRQQALASICAQARARLETLNGRVTYHDEAGLEVKVSEAQRRQEADSLASDIQEHCR